MRRRSLPFPYRQRLKSCRIPSWRRAPPDDPCGFPARNPSMMAGPPVRGRCVLQRLSVGDMDTLRLSRCSTDWLPWQRTVWQPWRSGARCRHSIAGEWAAPSNPYRRPRRGLSIDNRVHLVHTGYRPWPVHATPKRMSNSRCGMPKRMVGELRSGVAMPGGDFIAPITTTRAGAESFASQAYGVRHGMQATMPWR